MTTKNLPQPEWLAVSPQTFDYEGLRASIPDLAALYMNPLGLAPDDQKECVADLLQRYDGSDAANEPVERVAALELELEPLAKARDAMVWARAAAKTAVAIELRTRRCRRAPLPCAAGRADP